MKKHLCKIRKWRRKSARIKCDCVEWRSEESACRGAEKKKQIKISFSSTKSCSAILCWKRQKRARAKLIVALVNDASLKRVAFNSCSLLSPYLTLFLERRRERESYLWSSLACCFFIISSCSALCNPPSRPSVINLSLNAFERDKYLINKTNEQWTLRKQK